MGVDIPLASENWPLTQQGRVQVTFSPAQADLFCRVYATDLDNIVTLQKGTGTGLTTSYWATDTGTIGIEVWQPEDVSPMAPTFVPDGATDATSTTWEIHYGTTAKVTVRLTPGTPGAYRNEI
jgi:hypothetical protein